MSRRALPLAAAAVALLWAAGAAAETVASPDGRVVVTLDADGEGVPFYSVARDGQPVIAKSALGFTFTDADPMRRGFAVAAHTADHVDTRWEQPWGERRWVADRHNEIALTFRQGDAAARAITVRVRVFDDGIGFRYEFPENPAHPVTKIAEELTEFNLASDGEAWSIPAGDWNRYEYLYSKTPVSALSTVHTPVTMKLADGTHLSFHEAALVDYSAMWLKRMDGTRLRALLSPAPGGAKVVRSGAFTTPWRTIQIADGPKGLFESSLILNLNEPNALGDVSWVKPMKFVGVWWEMHLDKTSWASGARHGATTQNTKRYIDFAAANGFKGVLVEGWNKGWDGNWFGNGREFSFTQSYPDYDFPALAAYARAKGVELIGHHETGGNIAVYEAQMDAAFALDEKLGVHAVKTGYVADAGGIISCNALITDPCGAEVFAWHDGQRAVQHHLAVVAAAARHHVAIDPHEPVKDTGLRRTYPNWIAREGARGGEYDAWGVPKNPPSHVPSLIFTRLLAGPMDYTPGVFSLEGRGASGPDIPSTLARQLAYYVAIYSPVQMVADLPENLERYPQALDFVKRVPVDWNESLLIDGAVGEFAVVARQDRGSRRWYLGGVTDDRARRVRVPLGFLDKGRRYTATIWQDGPGADGLGADRHAMTVTTRTVTAGDTLDLAMARAGGFAVELR